MDTEIAEEWEWNGTEDGLDGSPEKESSSFLGVRFFPLDLEDQGEGSGEGGGEEVVWVKEVVMGGGGGEVIGR